MTAAVLEEPKARTPQEIYETVRYRQHRIRQARLAPPLVRLWDGKWRLRAIVNRINSAHFEFVDLDTGTGYIEIPYDYYLSKWITNIDVIDPGGNHGLPGRKKDLNLHITVDKDGTRWSGRMSDVTESHRPDGKRFLRLVFKHDYESLRHILVWCNPVFPAQVQFPRYWMLWGKLKWICLTTLFVNLLRLNASPFRIPDNPLDFEKWVEWIGKGFNWNGWDIIVRPWPLKGILEPDSSMTGLLHSRFFNFHDATRDLCADGEMTWELRRYLKGDPEPWPGAFGLWGELEDSFKNGALIVDLVDKSGWNSGTSFGGSLISGLKHDIVKFLPGGLNNFPQPDPNWSDADWGNVEEYRGLKKFLGVLPKAPAIVYRAGEHTGIQATEIKWQPATDTNVVGGGQSLAGVNEGIRAGLNLLGDLTSTVSIGTPVGQVALPPMGPFLEALVYPFVENTLMAWGKWESTERARRLGDSYYWEHRAEGADNLYSINGALAMRKGFYDTREILSHTVQIVDGAPWRIGQRGYGHYFLGDRVGIAPEGHHAGLIFTDRVQAVGYGWDRDTSPLWEIKLGYRPPEDPLRRLYDRVDRAFSILHAIGAP